MKISPMLCTVSSKFTAHSVVPEDGLCDFLFFESLYDDQKNVVREPYKAGFDYFLKQKTEMAKTTLGVSFSPINDTVFIEAESADFLGAVGQMWQRGVSHFGALNLQGAYTSLGIQQKFLKLLQKIYHLVTHKGSAERPCYTVIASFCHSATEACTYFEKHTSYEELQDHVQVLDHQESEVFDYFERAYICVPSGRNRTRMDTPFPPTLWRCHDRLLDGLPKNNKSVESWHNSLQQSLFFRHPDHFRLIAAMKHTQSLTEQK
ncbi:uncharacterized protein LOC144133968 [Amblyomma americanum]